MNDRAERMIARALDESLGGGRPVPRSPLPGVSAATGDWRADLLAVKDQAGSGRKAAKALGIGETTWRGWLKRDAAPGSKEAARVREALTARPVGLDVLRWLAMDSTAAARWRNNNWRLRIDTGQGERILTDRNTRHTELGEFGSATGDRVVDAWLSGDSRKAARLWLRGIGDQWYRETFFDDWITEDSSYGPLTVQAA